MPDYIDHEIADAIGYLGIRHNTVRNWAVCGNLPTHRNPVNGDRLFKRRDLDSFFKKTAKPVKPGA